MELWLLAGRSATQRGCHLRGDASAAIHAREEDQELSVALEDREGPYHLTAEGRAEWRGSGGFAYHYDGSPDGCPAQIAPPQPHSDTRELAPDWQSIYD
jgi:hypothetical protein